MRENGKVVKREIEGENKNETFCSVFPLLNQGLK